MERLYIKWEDFQANVSKSFSSLRKEQDFHDVTLISDDNEVVSAHKVVLSASSEFFKSVLKRADHAKPMIYLNGIRSKELGQILDYIYEGEVRLFQEDLHDFLSITERLKINGLRGAETKSEYCGQDIDWKAEVTYNSSKDYHNDLRGTETKPEYYSQENDWKEKVTYNSSQDYHDSPVFTEIKDQYTLRRKHNLEYGESQHFICKFARRKKYVECPHKYKIIFPAKDSTVIVQEQGSHLHQLNKDIVNTSVGFWWSTPATEVVMNGVKASSTPKAIFNSLRDQGCFPDGVEPTKIQLYNKIAHVKKIYNLSEILDIGQHS